MAEKVLLISNSQDYSTSLIAGFLTQKNISIIRVNVDTLKEDGVLIKLSYSDLNGGGFISIGKNRIDFEHIKSILYRQVHWSNSSPLLENMDEFVRQEWRYSLWSFATSCENFWVNHPFWSDRLLEQNKYQQGLIAKSVGLTVPDTIISNSYDDIWQFCAQHNNTIACKPVHNQILRDANGDSFGIYTRKLSLGDLPKIKKHVAASPFIVQEYIPKQVEIRLTVIGRHFFACEIHSQNSKKTIEDWRRYDFDNVLHRVHILPSSVENKILAFMRNTNLNFGAIDLILRPDGEYVFLEINPNGQYAWIESLTGMSISKVVAESLAAPELNGLTSTKYPN